MMESTRGIYSLLPLQPSLGIAPDQRGRVLGVTYIGDSAAARNDGLPAQFIEAPLLGHPTGTFGEIWFSNNGICRSGEAEGLRYCQDENILYGVIDIDESDLSSRTGAPALQKATEDAYRRIFRLLDAQGYPHLWRVWNYFSGINIEQDGLERYRQFNIGRQEAFVASGRLIADSIPAACALGTTNGPLTISFMAGRAAPRALENPRQVNACDYPVEYGPRSPTFSRGVIAHLPGQELLFISGTASIVGHRTVHPGNLPGQTRETIANIAAVLEEANRVTLAAPYSLAELSYRAYLRRAEDFSDVRTLLEELIGPKASVIYVQADICRADLLVEIEAMASRAVGTC